MFNRKFWTTGIFAALLVGLLTFGWTTPVQAFDRDHDEKCERRVHRAEEQLREAERRHGEHSRQVDNDVARMDSDRQWCRDHKADWDHDRFDIGVYFHK